MLHVNAKICVYQDNALSEYSFHGNALSEKQKEYVLHIYPSAVMNTKCDFNCFNIVEVVRLARVLQKYMVTMATLGGAQSQRVFFITTLIDRYRYQI